MPGGPKSSTETLNERNQRDPGQYANRKPIPKEKFSRHSSRTLAGGVELEPNLNFLGTVLKFLNSNSQNLKI
jgi:hypothetical protein